MTVAGPFELIAAGPEEIGVLVRHHRLMFQEIWDTDGMPYALSDLDAMEKSYQSKLHKELQTKSCSAWVVLEGGRAAASGAVSILSMVPSPIDSSCNVAYLHSIFTEQDHRRKGLATWIVKHAVRFCRESGIRRMVLNASEAAKPIYKKIGFEPATKSMQIFIR